MKTTRCLNLLSKVTYFLTLWPSLRYISIPFLMFEYTYNSKKIFAGEQPFNEKKSESNVISAILNGSRPVLPESIERSADLANLVRQSWSQNAEQRPTARQICRGLGLVWVVFLSKPHLWPVSRQLGTGIGLLHFFLNSNHSLTLSLAWTLFADICHCSSRF